MVRRTDTLPPDRDAGNVAEEVVQHLISARGATFELSAELPECAPDKLVRDVTENRRTLRFSHHGFEES